MAILDFSKFQEVSCGTRAELDIIFVHGLDGLQSRWDCVFETQWIKSHVAERFRNARILTFGYSASYTAKGSVEAISYQAQALLDNLEFSKSQDSKLNHYGHHLNSLDSVYSTETCRSLLFVSHSVGGIIVKQALSIAKRRQNSSIVERTHGILFLGSLCCFNADSEDWNQSSLHFDGHASKCAISTTQAGAFHHIAMNYHIIRLCEDDVRCAAPYANCDCIWQRASGIKAAMVKDDHFRIPNSFTLPQLLDLVYRCISSLIEAAKNVRFSENCERQQSTRQMIKEATLPGSCDWLHKSSQFLTWAHTGLRQPFWVRGASGTGKTFLASALVDHLLTEGRNVFYYFHPFHYELEAAIDLLNVLACQLTHVGYSTLRKTSLDLLPSRENDREGPIDREAFHSRFSTLLDMIGDKGKSVIVIDGLDEFPCYIREIILERIQSRHYIQPSPFEVQCIVTTRQACPRQSRYTELILEASESHNREVSNYAARKLGGSFWKPYREELSAIHECLSARANGCFLWVNLSLQILEANPIKKLIEAILMLPRSLNEMYSRILQNIPSKHTRVMQTVFSWLMTNQQPLKLGEISDALRLELNSHTYESGNFTAQVAHKLPEIMGGLVTISTDEIISLIHPSCKNYLLSLAIGSSENFPLTQAHQKVAQGCMILTKNFMSSSRRRSRSRLAECEMKSYATQHWSHHFRQATPPGQTITGPLQRSLEEICNQWLCEHEETGMKHDTRAHAQNLLNVGAFHGLSPLVSMGLEMGADAKGRLCPDCPTALVLAVRAGHLATVELLLQEQAGVPTIVLTGPQSPLFYAVIQGRLDIVELLLDAGASVDTHLDDQGDTALHLAANASSVTMTKLLIAHGADISDTNKQYLDSPLHIAAAVGSTGVIEALLKQCSPRGSTISSSRTTLRSIRVVNTQNVFGQTPLHIAASNGHHAVLECLLAEGADSQLVDNDGRTALHFACEQGHSNIATFLAQVAFPSDAYLDSLLTLAEGNGHTTTVAKLTELMLFRLQRSQIERSSISPGEAANYRSFKVVTGRQRVTSNANSSPPRH